MSKKYISKSDDKIIKNLLQNIRKNEIIANDIICTEYKPMTAKDIRKLSGLTQEEFSKKYDIPLSTIKGWESSPNSTRYRQCPEYILKLLERVVREDCN